MLTDVEIDNLIQPFADRQKLLEDYVIKIIADRVKSIGTMLPSDIHKLERIYRTGADVKAINKAIADMTGLQVKDIKKLIKNVAGDVYEDAKPYYDYRHITQIPIAQNMALQRTINAISWQTERSFKNLSNSKMIGFVIRDRKHPKKLKFYNAADTYKTIVDEAIQASQNGTIDYNTAMRNTIKQLSQSGLKTITWESGYKQRMDTVVKRNILDGIRQISLKIMQLVGDQFGSNGYEITVHHNPAPDHAPFQGHIFSERQFERLQSNKKFKDIKGNKFPAQKRIIGQYNCKHFAYPLVLEGAVPTYTDEQLQEILDENEKGVTLPNGKHLTGYEVTQKENELALKVRQLKDEQMTAQEAGDIEGAKMYQAKVTKAIKAYNAFNKIVKQQMPSLSPRKDKMRVTGYKKISTK